MRLSSLFNVGPDKGDRRHGKRPPSETAQSCHAANTHDQLRGSGRFADRYDLLPKTVGAGSFALVRECKEKRTGKVWAVKIMRMGDGSSPSSSKSSRNSPSSLRSALAALPVSPSEAIYDELRVLASLRQTSGRDAVRSAIQMREFYEERDATSGVTVVYIVTELLAGGHLQEALTERGSLAEEDVRSVFRSLMECLVDIQARGIIHRDVKLENIMMSTPHEFHSGIKLIDFGLATDVNVSGPATEMCGTPHNVAPEVIAMGLQRHASTDATTPSKGYGSECDIWSAGTALYSLLSGQAPFELQGDFRDLYAAILEGDYDFRDPAWHMVSDSARDLVSRCLTTDPEKRITAGGALAHPWMQGA
eukprot:CAMPEP_0117654948 /NCGR_PEP_ID=MMETSP0804-20121206/4020_1 /TAXON_ID=1074897 /ORGANISM="Tetraselmis astigmatica, Strain CCMP880" /LENGTH=362 /DNA_ID=CAMNT_0005461271 /DNA_START=1 /DNA_END=1089 /DNA_ORIENTATION=-